MAEKCFLCKKNLTDCAYIFSKKKGIIQLIKSSLQREDGKHLELNNLSIVPVHISCSANYNRKSNIRLSLKKMKLNRSIEKHLRQPEQQDQQLIIDDEQKKVKTEIVDDDDDSTKRQIIEAAASIIRKDMGLMMYSNLSNPNFDRNFLQDPKNIPESLNIFLTKIFKTESNCDSRSFEHISLAQSFFVNYLININNV